MCGISGCLTQKISQTNESVIDLIIKDQNARGPDFHAITQIKTNTAEVILGHNRLSIIDLSAQANQPMFDINDRWCVVYNGEIYNYLELRQELIQLGYDFKTKSDTEVILNAFSAWGVDAISRFNGPFAFAIFDKINQQLFLVRDRFGVKPLYFYIDNQQVYFASSSNVLAKHFNLKPNLNYVARGLKFLIYEDDTSITAFENLNLVPAAHYLQVSITNDGQLNLAQKSYYDLQQEVEKRRVSLQQGQSVDILEELTNLLDSAVTLRLRADVPIGISLSGGLDSSSVAALAAKKHPQVKGFTFGDKNNKTTEGPLVAQLAEKIGIDVEYIWPSPREIVANLQTTLTAQNAPFASLSIIAQQLVYQRVHAAKIKVLLGGQGGDEGFMGYRKYQLYYLKQLLNKKDFILASKFLCSMLPMFFAELDQLKLYWRHRKRFVSGSGLDTVLQLPSVTNAASEKYSDLSFSSARQFADVTQNSLPTLLRYEDRNSMGNSVESRLPFLDYRVIEFGLALPTSEKLQFGYGKWPVRALMQGKLPDDIRLARYKRGFDIPLEQLIQAGLGAEIRGLLQQKSSKIESFLVSGQTLEQAFSDAHLIQRQAAIAEAITLLWLSQQNI